jgi:hypothetical protein
MTLLHCFFLLLNMALNASLEMAVMALLNDVFIIAPCVLFLAM